MMTVRVEEKPHKFRSDGHACCTATNQILYVTDFKTAMKVSQIRFDNIGFVCPHSAGNIRSVTLR